jgi:hypothetical protein
MICTDDELKKFNNLVNDPDWYGNIDSHYHIEREYFKALLARLEAAERCLTWHHEEPGFYDAIKAWRKAAGK